MSPASVPMPPYADMNLCGRLLPRVNGGAACGVYPVHCDDTEWGVKDGPVIWWSETVSMGSLGRGRVVLGVCVANPVSDLQAPEGRHLPRQSDNGNHGLGGASRVASGDSHRRWH
jgi:hypothetical protein